MGDAVDRLAQALRDVIDEVVQAALDARIPPAPPLPAVEQSTTSPRMLYPIDEAMEVLV